MGFSPFSIKKTGILFCLIFSLFNTAFSQEDLTWNRYTTKNFVILSIDDNQGQWMSENIEELKTWCITRWGFQDFKFSKECRVFCVPTKALLKKLFNLNESKVELRRKGEEIEIIGMWIVLNNKPNIVVPIYLSQAVLLEYEIYHNVKIDFWAKRGISLLNNSNAEIRGHLIDLFRMLRSRYFTSEKIFYMDEEQYLQLSTEDQDVFDAQTIAICLMLKKEFGEIKFHNFLFIGNRLAQDKGFENLKIEDFKIKRLKFIYGFQNYEEFDKSYLRYMKDLSNEIIKQKTPDSYLNVKRIDR